MKKGMAPSEGMTELLIFVFAAIVILAILGIYFLSKTGKYLPG